MCNVEKNTFDIMNVEVEGIRTFLDQYSWTFYGVGGFGKTQLCASLFTDPAFWCWENGAKAVIAKKVPCPDWKTAQKYVKTLKKAFKLGKKMPFKTAIMDTVDLAWRRCCDWVCEQNDWSTPSEAPHGGGWAIVKEEFEGLMNDLESIGIEPVYVGHDKDKEFKPKNAEKYNQIVPSVPATCQEIIYDKPDFVVYCANETTKDEDGNKKVVRRLYFRNDGDFKSKSRLKYMPQYIEYQDSVSATARLIRETFTNAAIREKEEMESEFYSERKDIITPIETGHIETKKIEKKAEKEEKSSKKVENEQKIKENAKKEEMEAERARAERKAKREAEKRAKEEAESKTKEVKKAEMQEETTKESNSEKTSNSDFATLKKELSDRFTEIYYSGEKSPVELISVIEGATGETKISNLTTMEQLLALSKVL